MHRAMKLWRKCRMCRVRQHPDEFVRTDSVYRTCEGCRRRARLYRADSRDVLRFKKRQWRIANNLAERAKDAIRRARKRGQL